MVYLFRMMAGFSECTRFSIFLSFPLSVLHIRHKYTQNRSTQTYVETHQLGSFCSKQRCADCPLRLLHYPFCVFFLLSAPIFTFLLFPLCACAHTAYVRCVHILFLSPLSDLLSFVHPSLISPPSSRTHWPPTQHQQREGSVSQQRTQQPLLVTMDYNLLPRETEIGN